MNTLHFLSFLFLFSMASFVQINICGLRAKTLILAQYLDEHKADFLLLNETKLIPDSVNPNIPGYILVARQDVPIAARGHAHGGTAIYAKSGLQTSYIDTTHLPNQCSAVSINIPGIGNTALVSIYLPPFVDLHSISFTFFINTFDRVIFMGDFNAFHPCISDSCQPTNRTGRALHQILLDHPLNIINYNGDPTRNHNLLDLIITTNHFIPFISEHFVGEDVSSDHLPLHFLLSANTGLPYQVRLRRNLEKADWDKFRTLTDSNIHQLPPLPPPFPLNTQTYLTNIDNICINISDSITHALDQVAPLKPVKHRSFTLPASILQLIREKRKARKLVQRNPNSEIYISAYKELTKLVSISVKEEKAKQWHSACENLNHMQAAPFWKQFKRLTAKNCTPRNSQQVVDPNGNLTTSDHSTAEVLANHLASCHVPNSGPQFMHEAFAEVTQEINENSFLFSPQIPPLADEDEDHPAMQPITKDSIIMILRKCKSSTSPGADGITYRILKQCPISLFVFLAQLFSLLRCIGYFPKPWKSAIGVMIPKAGKDPKIPGNNRPISLLSCIGKLFEKSISVSLVNFLTGTGLLNKWQRAYLPKKEASEHLFRFSTHIRWGRQLGQSSAAILLDVEKAFDSVWQDGLRSKMADLPLPSKIIRLLSSFLQDRTIAVRVGKTVSSEVHLQAGTPQGSVLSPILFLIFVHDLPFNDSDTIQISQFADDLCFWTSCRTNSKRALKLMQTKLQEAMERLEIWCSRWHIKLNTAKSQLLYFPARQTKIPADIRRIHLFGAPIPECSEAKLLGLTVTTPTCSLLRHCRNQRAKAESRINLLRCIRGTSWGANVPTLLKLYRTFIRPILEVGYVATVNANNSDLYHLIIAENKALRVALKQFYTPGVSRTSNQRLYEMFDEPLIDQRIEHLYTKAMDRFGHSDLVQETESILRHMVIHKPRSQRAAPHPRLQNFIDFVFQQVTLVNQE